MNNLTWSGGEVLDEGGEERSGLEIIVMFGGEILSGVDQLEANELESLLLEARDDIGDQATVDTVGLDGNEGSLLLSSSGSCISIRWRMENGKQTVVGNRGSLGGLDSGDSEVAGDLRDWFDQIIGMI